MHRPRPSLWMLVLALLLLAGIFANAADNASRAPPALQKLNCVPLPSDQLCSTNKNQISVSTLRFSSTSSTGDAAESPSQAYYNACRQLDGLMTMISIKPGPGGTLDTSNANNIAIDDITVIVSHDDDDCNQYVALLMRSTSQAAQYLCPADVKRRDLLSALIQQRTVDSGKSANMRTNLPLFTFCNGTEVSSFFNRHQGGSSIELGMGNSNLLVECSEDTSASAVGWTDWFKSSTYFKTIQDLGLSGYASGIQAKQAQTTCMARRQVLQQLRAGNYTDPGYEVPNAGDIQQNDLVSLQLQEINAGQPPLAQLSTTRAQLSSFQQQGTVKHLVLYSDSICTPNEFGKCLNQVRYYCQPNATAMQPDSTGQTVQIPNGCFFQRRVRDVGVNSTDDLPLFNFGLENQRSRGNYLENAQHGTDWELVHDVFKTTLQEQDYTQYSLLPRGAQLQDEYSGRGCSNQSFAVTVPFFNKLFGVSNLRVVTQNGKNNICVLGRATQPVTPGQCVGWLESPPGDGLVLPDTKILTVDGYGTGSTAGANENVQTRGCFTNVTGKLELDLPDWPADPAKKLLPLNRSSACHENSQIIMLGQQIFRDKPSPPANAACELKGSSCPADYPNGDYSNPKLNSTSDRSCYSWFTSLGNLGVFEITNKTNIENYLDPKLIVGAPVWKNKTNVPRNLFDVYVKRPFLKTSGPYIGWGDGVLCGQEQHMLTAAANCYNSCYQNWTAALAKNQDGTTVCKTQSNWLFSGPTGASDDQYHGEQCQMIFERYRVVYHQLGAPAQAHSRNLAGTLGSATFGILNPAVGNLGNVMDTNTTVTSGRVHFSPQADAFALPIKYAAAYDPTLWPTGHCYTPLQALPGYGGGQDGAYNKSTSVALPTAQALAKLQLESNDALLADQLSAAVGALQNAASLQAPTVNLATLLLTITACLGALTAVKVLELYTQLWVLVKLTRAGWIKRLIAVVCVTTVLLVFSIAPVIAMVVQEHIARTSPFSTTYGNFLQFDVPGTQSTTLSIISASVTYQQDSPYFTWIVAVAAILFATAAGWWVYATGRILQKLHRRWKIEHFNKPSDNELEITRQFV